MSKLLAKLEGRGVARVAAAYIAVSWLILQVLDTVSSILPFPAWIGRFTLIAISVGFPIALLLAWTYRLTGEGHLEREDESAPTEIQKFGSRKADFVIIGALLLVVVMLIVERQLTPTSIPQDNLARNPIVTGYKKLSESPVFLPPFSSLYPLVTDGSRIYFNDFDGGEIQTAQLSVYGGSVSDFETPFEEAAFVVFEDIGRDKSTLIAIVGRRHGTSIDTDIWSFPVVGGSPRRLIEDGRGGAMSFAGDKLAYMKNRRELYVHEIQKNTSELVATMPPISVYWPKFSPDGERVRFTHILDHNVGSLWEVPVASGEPEPLLPGFAATSACCGSWSPDGRYYVFEAQTESGTQLWAIKDSDDGSVAERAPFQITSGVIDFKRPVFSDDGKAIYAVGWQLRGEAAIYDGTTDRFVPIPGFVALSFEQFNFSSDGEWVAFVSYPDGELWKKKTGISQPVQLTFGFDRVAHPKWALDGKSILFEGWSFGGNHGIYLVSAAGGKPELVSGQDENARSAAWMADGERLVFSVSGQDRPVVYNVASKTRDGLPGDGKLWGITWSPDGQQAVGWSGGDLVRYDVADQAMHTLVSDISYEDWIWSADGKSVYAVDSFLTFGDRSIYQISMRDLSVNKILTIGKERIAWGTAARNVSITPEGNLIILRDHSIHDIYALEWNPD